MKGGGYVGIGLGAVASGLAIQEVCSAAPDSPECKRIKFTEGGNLMGSVTVKKTVALEREGVSSERERNV